MRRHIPTVVFALCFFSVSLAGQSLELSDGVGYDPQKLLASVRSRYGEY
jgi:hypothetical protein